MVQESSMYGAVYIETAGVDARHTDALEALLALCRLLGLTYTISRAETRHDGQPGPGSITVKLTTIGPLDYFVPREQRQEYIYVGLPETGAAEVLMSAMTMAVRHLKDNAEAYRQGFHRLWEEKTGASWLAGKEAAP
jgi:hypothetical protein